MADDLEVCLFRNGFGADVVELVNLAFREGAAEAGDDFHHADVVGPRRLEEGHGEEIVAEKYGHLVVEDGIDGALAAALGAFVHHVVVYERCGVEEFERDGRTEGRLPYFTQLFRHEQHQQGAHHLPFAAAQVGERTAQEVIVVGQCTVEQSLVAKEFFGHRLSKLGEFVHVICF